MSARLLASLTLMLTVCTLTGIAAEKGGNEAAASPSELSIKQDTVSGEMGTLEQKMTRLIQQLRESDPQQAKRLSRALKEARRAMLKSRMETVSTQLKQLNFDVAVDEQGTIVNDLITLLDTLKKRENNYEKLQKKIDQLQKWNKEINKLSRKEWKHKRESEKVSRLQKSLEQLATRIAALKKLKKQQTEIHNKTKRTLKTGSQDFNKLAEKQEKVRHKTASLAQSIAQKAGQSKADAGKGSKQSGKSNKKTAGAKSGKKSGSAGRSGQGAKQQQSSSPSTPSKGQSPDPGQKPLHKATEQQRSSQKNLTRGKARSATKNQKQALDAMDKALAEMKKERQRLASLPSDHNRSMAVKQDATASKTGQLAQQMKAAQSGSSGSSKSGQSGGKSGGQSGKKSAAAQDVKKAQSSMNKASKQLREKETGKAAGKQKKAHEQLQNARKDIDKQLRELRKEQRQALLAELISIFRKMLNEQETLTEETAVVPEKDDSEPSRSRQLKCGKLADREGKLAEAAQQALEMMQENSSPVVFPRVVRNVKTDLNTISGRLQDGRTAGVTHSLQTGVEQTLSDLLEALKKAQQNPPPSDSKSGKGKSGKSPKPPLINPLAELKLLRNTQVQINSQTEKLHKQKSKKASSADINEAVQTLTERQASVSEMMHEFRQKLLNPGDSE